MKKILLYLAALLPFTAMAQTGNYVKNTVYRIPTTTSITNPSVTQAAVQITYLDGLGRPIQQRGYRESNTGNDIVTHIEYDNLGRQIREYLPYPSSSASLNYDPGAKTALMSYYASTNVPATAYPYSEKKLEESPFNRLLAQYAPGEAWANPASTGNTDHGIRFDYLANTDSDQVRLFKASAGTTKGNYNITLINSVNYYDEGELTKTVTKNENWTSGTDNATEEFKDKEGRVVLKRVYGISKVKNNLVYTPHDTYYVYDQYGNLTFVLPPLVDTASTITTAILNDLCYQYKYDYRNRLVEKKLPGAAWEFIVYDKLNRIVATGPANSPFSDLTGTGWMITKYDIFNRPVLTGWMPVASLTIESADRKVLQDERNLETANFSERKTTSDTDMNGVPFGYSNVALPTSDYHVMTVNYYDDYEFTGMPVIPTTVEGQAVFYNTTQKPKGLATGTWIRILQASTALDGALTYTLYDKKARVLQARTINYLAGYTQVDSKMDEFSGRLLYTMTRHKRTAADNEIATKDSFTYTDQGRLLKHSKQIGTDPEQMLSKNEYNELGQLIVKRVGNYPAAPTEAGLQKIDYAYTIRGWLSGINKTEDEDGSSYPLKQGADPGDLFAFRLAYDNPAAALPLYNGNISEAYWRTASDNTLRKYAYHYDAMNRMREAAYTKPGITSTATSYDESAIYDKNGNIQSLERYGEFDDNVASLKTDNLTYTYDTAQQNKLLAVSDDTYNPNGFNDGNTAGNDFAYDEYGNMVKDLNKDIGTATTDGIIYNHLRLPTKITFAGGNTIEYLYTATGKKLQKKVTEGTVVSTTDYLDGFVYFNNVLKFFPTSEGYVNNTVVNGNNVYNYVYNYTDHLGNVRLSYGVDPSNNALKILEENNYYPFGLKHKNYNMSEKSYIKSGGGVVISPPCENCPRTYKYQYKYNGKELQDELGLNMTAMDFRQYDNALGRFNAMDKLSEMEYSNTPYHFAANNPVYFNDPTGLSHHWPGGTASTSTSNMSNWVAAMWVTTADGSNSTWENGGNGNFDNTDGSGWVNSGDGEYNQNQTYMYQLDNVNVIAGATTTFDPQGYVYNNSSFYNSGSTSGSLQKAGYFTGDVITGTQAFNLGASFYGLAASITQRALMNEAAYYQNKGTQTALKYVAKNIAPSLKNIGRISKGLGYAGVALTVYNVGKDFSNGKDLTASQVFDVALATTFAVVAVSNPIGLVVLGVYGLLDAGGVFDSVKSSLGGDTVIYKSPFKKS